MAQAPSNQTIAVGIDSVNIARLQRSLSVARSLESRLFSRSERSAAAGMLPARRFEFLAGRFAVKEAVVKALGCGLVDTLPFSEIEVMPDKEGRPRISFFGQAAEASSAMGCVGTSSSISHSDGHVIAVALLTMGGCDGAGRS